MDVYSHVFIKAISWVGNGDFIDMDISSSSDSHSQT